MEAKEQRTIVKYLCPLCSISIWHRRRCSRTDHVDFECNEGENKFSLRDDKGKTRKVYYKK